MTDDEMASEGWNGRRNGAPSVMVLSNGTKLYPSQDPEGNGPGALFGEEEDGAKVAYISSDN